MVKKHTNKSESNTQDSGRGTMTWLIIILIITAIVISTLSLVSFGGDEEDRNYSTYNHYSFEKVGDKWQTQVSKEGQLFNVPSYNHPYDLQHVSYDVNVSRYFFDTPHAGFKLLIDEGSSNRPVVAGINTARILGEKYYGFKIDYALYGESDETITTNSSTMTGKNTTIGYATCDGATEMAPRIHFSTEEQGPVVKMSENHPHCIIVGGSTCKEVIEASDTFVFHILKIMR